VIAPCEPDAGFAAELARRVHPVGGAPIEIVAVAARAGRSSERT